MARNNDKVTARYKDGELLGEKKKINFRFTNLFRYIESNLCQSVANLFSMSKDDGSSVLTLLSWQFCNIKRKRPH